MEIMLSGLKRLQENMICIPMNSFGQTIPSFNRTDNFDKSFSSDWNYEDGQWSILNGAANINHVGKRTMGNVGWSDYIVECDIQGIDNLNSGIMVRVQNPARGGAGDDPGLGADFYQGYFAGLSTAGVSLGKQNYSWTTLASTPERYDTNTWYHMKVAVSRNTIKVYVGDMIKPKIDYTTTATPLFMERLALGLTMPTRTLITLMSGNRRD